MDMVAPAIDSAPLPSDDVDEQAAIEPGQITVIFNPTAGSRRHRKLRAALHALAELGLTATVVETKGPGDAERIARHAAKTDRGIVVVAGGDGTINEAVNGLLSVQGPIPPLAIIPLGTANVLALEIGLSTDPRAAARAIAGNKRLTVRPGCINGRNFVMMVGIGFDGAVVAGVSTKWKRRIGRGIYAVRTFVEAWRYPFPKLRGTIDGVAFAARWVVVCRGRHYGGPFVVAPEASLALPRLSVCLLPGSGPWSVLRYGIALISGRMPWLSDIVVKCGQTVTVEAEGDLPIQGDGDIVARLPVEISLSERPIELIVPA
ncbi:MAG TPA: diacylglycerol kinase family protein [Magnetospirillaceae bacterium]|jgi:YegS/Rv2252/BmrU family lipid kinase